MPNKSYTRYRTVTPLPMYLDGGTVGTLEQQRRYREWLRGNFKQMADGGGVITPMVPLDMSSTYMPTTTRNIQAVDNPAPNASNMNWLSTGLGALGSAANAYNSTGSAGSLVSSLVDTGIKSIPVAGQIIAAADMVLDPITQAIGASDPGNKYVQTTERLLNPLNSLESGISNLIDGNSSQGWTDLASVVLPGIGGTADAAAVEKQKTANRNARNAAGYQKGMSTPISGPMVAEMGGVLPQITEYNAGGQHGENPNGGIPIDASGNRSIVSNARPVALVEQNEVAWFNPTTKRTYVFSDKLHISD